MKVWGKLALVFILLLLVSLPVLSEEKEDYLIPIYPESKVLYDNQIGYEEIPIIMSDSSFEILDGTIRRIFMRIPEGRSPLEVVKNYERAIINSGGEIIFKTRAAQEIDIEEHKFEDLFDMTRPDQNTYAYWEFPGDAKEFLSGKIDLAGTEVYISVAAGYCDYRNYYELITLIAEPMDTGMITASAIGDSLRIQGKIALYDILFDTGKAEVKAESAPAMEIIAQYLNSHKDEKVVVVGHTDNTGDFDANLELSLARAEAVIAKLVADYGVNKEQLKAFGAGSVAPVASNATELGRAKNRRVEIVEY